MESETFEMFAVSDSIADTPPKISLSENTHHVALSQRELCYRSNYHGTALMNSASPFTQLRCAALLPPGIFNRCALFAVFVLCFSSTLSGQAPSASSKNTNATLSAIAPVPAPTKSDVSKEALIFEKRATRVRKESDGTGSDETLYRVRVLADAGVKAMAVLTFTYAALNQQVEIDYVRVLKPNGTIIVTPSYNVQDLPADVTRAAPMYSDIHQKHVAVKGLGVGDILEYRTVLRTLKPEVPGQFWFQYAFEKEQVILYEQLDLDLPADKKTIVASSDVQPTVTVSSGRKLYHWSSSNLARPDPDAPPKSKKHWKPSVQVSTFSSWAEVGAWYQSLQRDSLLVTPAIQARVATLTKGLTSDDEKLNAIFNDVALHTHYVGLEFGIGRYQPHSADDVLSNEYGDCKDKHTLLATELKAAGIQAWPVLISSVRELDATVPSPAQFNHVITVVPRNGSFIWMDSTEEIAPVGVIMSPLRDKDALMVPDDKPASVERTPENMPFAQSVHFLVEGKLTEKGVFTGHVSQNYRGDVELMMRQALRMVPQSQWKTVTQIYSDSIGLPGEISNPQISDVEQTVNPVEFSYDYTREKFPRWNDHFFSPPLPAIGWELGPGVKEKKPADDRELGSPGELIYTSKIEFPKGWSVIPQLDVDLKEDWAEFHSTYRFRDGVYIVERRILVKKRKVPLDQWEKYLAFRRLVYDDQDRMSPVLAISSKSTDPQFTALKEQMLAALQPLVNATALLRSSTPSTPENLARAMDLCKNALGDIETITRTLEPDRLLSLPWVPALSVSWSTYGWAALKSGNLATAENYLRAAWHLSQDRLSGYLLADLLKQKGDSAAAAHLMELASIVNIDNAMGGSPDPNRILILQIAEDYQKITGKPLTATPLNHGAYKGSLRAELDRSTEIRSFIPHTKLSGQGLFMVAYEAGRQTKAYLLHGDKRFAAFTEALEGTRFPVPLPTASRAQLLRMVELICSPYAGCDASIVLPTAAFYQMQSIQVLKQGQSPFLNKAPVQQPNYAPGSEAPIPHIELIKR